MMEMEELAEQGWNERVEGYAEESMGRAIRVPSFRKANLLVLLALLL